MQYKVHQKKKINKKKNQIPPQRNTPLPPNSHSSCLALGSMWDRWLPNSKAAFNHVSSQIAGLPARDLQGVKNGKTIYAALWWML